ncbi:MAG: P1 family peptidase [Candidatus Dormibacteria bacterium]
MTPPEPGAGPTNSLTDVPGLRVGHASRVGEGWLTGTTVVLAADAGAVAGIDIRGGGPGTRETDLLEPRNLIERVHAVVLSGGSAFGLASVDGVLQGLAAEGIGLRVGSGPQEVVPIVPAAIIFDLGRGGEFRNHPNPQMGAAALDDARGPNGKGPVRQGCVGAGQGAVAGGLKGGVGSASLRLSSGQIVGALAVVNAGGSTVDSRTGRLWASSMDLDGEHEGQAERARPAGDPTSPSLTPQVTGLNTTVGVVATDAPLTKAQCQKLAEAAQDGLARAIHPAHTMFDGDTVFGLSTATSGGPVGPEVLNRLLAAAADCFTRAIGNAMLAATSTVTPAGEWRSYAEVHLVAP